MNIDYQRVRCLSPCRNPFARLWYSWKYQRPFLKWRIQLNARDLQSLILTFLLSWNTIISILMHNFGLLTFVNPFIYLFIMLLFLIIFYYIDYLRICFLITFVFASYSTCVYFLMSQVFVSLKLSSREMAEW